MCGGASCPLVEELVAGGLGFDEPTPRAGNRERTSGNARSQRAAACPAMHGIAILDVDSIVRYCNDGAAQALGAEPEAVSGRPLATLIPELKLRVGTPGYNLAYVRFWFPDQGWREVWGVTADGQPVRLDLSLSAVRVDGRHQLLVALRRSRGRSTPLSLLADTGCGSRDASPLQQVALLTAGGHLPHRTPAGAVLSAA